MINVIVIYKILNIFYGKNVKNKPKTFKLVWWFIAPRVFEALQLTIPEWMSGLILAIFKA